MPQWWSDVCKLPLTTLLFNSHTSQERQSTPSSPSVRSKHSRRSSRRGHHSSKGPAGFASIQDLLHRLFVAISGVADQLQTNHAKDLRQILKHVFAVCQSDPEPEPEELTTPLHKGKSSFPLAGTAASLVLPEGVCVCLCVCVCVCVGVLHT